GVAGGPARVWGLDLACEGERLTKVALPARPVAGRRGDPAAHEMPLPEVLLRAGPLRGRQHLLHLSERAIGLSLGQGNLGDAGGEMHPPAPAVGPEAELPHADPAVL